MYSSPVRESRHYDPVSKVEQGEVETVDHKRPLSPTTTTPFSSVDTHTKLTKETTSYLTNHPTSYCYLLTAIACLNSCNLGYDVGSTGGAALLMKEQMGWHDWQYGLFVGSINYFSIPGALNAGFVCDCFGRRRTFIMSCLIFITGVITQVASNNFLVAMIGRVFVGLGVGLGLAIDPLYISEIAPPEHRGHLVSFAECVLNTGITLGFIADFCLFKLPDGVNWRVMLGLGMVMPSILIFLVIFVMPESPRWLLLKGRVDEAKEILAKTYPPGSNMDEVVKGMVDRINQDKEEKEVGWSALLCPNPTVRLMLLAGIGMAACQQTNGSETIVYYSPAILEKAGFKSRTESFGLTILIGLSKAVFCFIAVFRADRLGRRPLVLGSMTCLAIVMATMGVLAPYPQLSAGMAACLCLYIACFSAAMGPLTWVVAGEVFPTTIRAKAMSLATSTNRFISGTVTLTTPVLSSALTQRGYFFMYAGITVLSGLYLYHYLPETKGKTLEEVEDYFTHLAEGKKKAKVEMSNVGADAEMKEAN